MTTPCTHVPANRVFWPDGRICAVPVVALTVFMLSGCGGGDSKSPTSPSSAGPSLNRLTVEAESETLQPFEHVPVRATAHFSDGSARDVTTEATWSSDDQQVATVSNGEVTAFRPGKAVIAAAYRQVSRSVEITVNRFARQTRDRADDVVGPQIKVMYVLPADGVDEELDINSTLAISVEAFQRWLERETGGRRLVIDTAGGQLDIAFARLRRTDAQLVSAGAFVRDRIESELAGMGFRTPGKIYAVYYGGRSRHACGGAFWPPTLPGRVVALYLNGTPSGAPPCNSNSFASSPNTPGYLEFGMLHEIFHGLGMVPTCAPNHTRAGHVSDDPSDLMYAGDLPWTPQFLDVNRDDYFGHGRGCLDLADSPYIQ